LFYLSNILIILYNLLLYFLFRRGIYNYLRLSRMSKSNIKKSRKGLCNYWLYYSINKQKPLGVLYHLNIVFLILTVLYSVMAVAVGYIEVMQSAIWWFSVLLCLAEIPASIIASTYNCKAEYGKPFVLLAKGKFNKRFYSSVFDVLSWGITAYLIYFAYQQL